MTGDRRFLQGNIACAEGALAAGCRFFAGYPITPATEIAEHLAQQLPLKEGVFIQMEDEIASIGAIIGASWTGAKVMTATSGPGLSLMQENIGYAIGTETPCVIVDVQRGGPSTGIPAVPSQSDMVQAARGSHGDYESIAFAPSSAQEMFDLTVRAFDTAERMRTPVLLMADAAVGHMREIVEMPVQLNPVERKLATIEDNGAPRFLDEQVAPMPIFGRGLKAHVTGSCHDEVGMRNVVDAEALDHYVRRLSGKIRNARAELVDVQAGDTEDAEILLVGWGLVGRAAQAIATQARLAGRRVGWIRPITVWPFADVELRDLCSDAKRVIVLENNLGQMLPYVQAAIGNLTEVEGLSPKILGTLHRPADVLERIAA
ncbi:MAG: 2-oxoacid:acceptor oxidoreductase subunit alpha [Gemmatimonadetes bacterium]|jgi:2-oxoglutarate ferredoxin oxidoreductase subunit alpha|nr:2-oxoacid:acceptor oxidoreductase subunit alpha [Gemmatimonadota bacterium]MBT5057399.1 2-oxoacid:acceptor oxidoreductase subunit alpha [Gemmatimonadota bacterium]MBT5146018.1 2-oxoacid:acceptor oxidoreductase subunit alpha [Gemmatimonadota bacterium]MBT5591903.1 2-oxoacid:acceptor oxidoreductase subunit alpha [Gemmatimonadota bacterium]MBT5961578.1 2-oxoacid:acceptor oxidoreductase subunit alpha [Gemmatimonadota bacterium]